MICWYIFHHLICIHADHDDPLKLPHSAKQFSNARTIQSRHVVLGSEHPSASSNQTHTPDALLLARFIKRLKACRMHKSSATELQMQSCTCLYSGSLRRSASACSQVESVSMPLVWRMRELRSSRAAARFFSSLAARSARLALQLLKDQAPTQQQQQL